MSQSAIRILGVPMDLGQSRRGVDMGPSAIRYAGLQERLVRLGYEVHDDGNIIVPQAEEMPEPFHGDQELGRAERLPEVARVCQEAYEQASKRIASDDIAIFLGGDHSISIGTVPAIIRQETIGVIWFDAHADLNNPHTSPSGNIHGMSVATLLGDGPPALTDIGYPGPKLRSEQVAMIGIRNLDHLESQKLARSGIQVHTMRHLDEEGVASAVNQILKRFAHLDRIHVSLDLDGLDPTVAPGVGTPVPGGLTYREAHLVMEMLADTGKVRSLDVVEINPILDNQNGTARVAVELAASLFGQRIM